jgi:hypothetical protein
MAEVKVIHTMQISMTQELTVQTVRVIDSEEEAEEAGLEDAKFISGYLNGYSNAETT